MTLRRPDFFVVGAPKCGTTALDNYLAQHPEIAMAPKELHYFGSDLQHQAFPGSKEDYLRLFPSTGTRAGETSVYYLYSLRAAAEIHDFAPNAEIIAMVRNPVDMLPSLHSQLVFDGGEAITDFALALAGDHDTSGRVRRPMILRRHSYRDAACFSSQLERYFERFGREKVHVIVFEDFVKDAASTYARVCEFLGVDPAFMPDVRPLNTNHGWRSERLRVLVQHPPQPVRLAARALPSRRLRGAIARWIQWSNVEYRSREPLAPELRAQLQAEFVPEVERLSELLGRDLTSWCRS
jgi:hypothetical protein